MKKIVLILIGFFLVHGTLLAQAQYSLEYVKLKPHPDVRIEYQKIRGKDVKQGRYTYYYRNQKIVDGKYVRGRKHGEWKRFYPNGNLAIKAFYVQDQKHGNWEYFYEDEHRLAVISFDSGKRTGLWTGWFADGWKYSEFNYRNDSLLGEQRLYYARQDLESGAQNNQIKLNAKVYYKNGQRLIYLEQYYDNGKLYRKCTKMGNEYVGDYEDYYYSGIPWKKLKFEDDGRLFSIFDQNNPVGRDADRGTFRDGNGEWYIYNSNGERFARMDYSQGFPDGKIVYYEEEEKELITGFFDDNVPIGSWKFYKPVTSREELIAEFNFVGPDTLHATIFTGDMKGRDEGLWIDNRKMDIWRKYEPSGLLIEESEYAWNFKHGKSTTYRESKLKAGEGYHAYGMKVGEWRYYNDFQKTVYREKFVNSIQADEGYLFSDSCRNNDFVENTFFSTLSYLTRDEKRLEYLRFKDYHINYDHFLHEGNVSTWPKGWKVPEYKTEEYEDYQLPNFPRFIPWGTEFRMNVVNDYDIGLFIETLNPRKLKQKKDRTSAKLGVAMVVLHLDEFGFVERARVVRGVKPEWDEKIEALFEYYRFWDPALLANNPIACSYQLKIPIELEVVKSMD